MEKSNLSNEKLLAYMYDFYNANTLKNQNDDITYYINYIKEYHAKNTLVVGAGTGRVAIPISEFTNVVALDIDNERLKILKSKNNKIEIVNDDILNYISNKKYDLIIFPYSVIQFYPNMINIDRILQVLIKLLDENGTIVFDFSENFNNKEDTIHLYLFENYCQDLKKDIKVFYSSYKKAKTIEFKVEYVIDNQTLIETE